LSTSYAYPCEHETATAGCASYEFSHRDEAKWFFEEFSQLYGQYPNVLFEIYNEPLKANWTADIKPYEQEMVDTIRNHSNNVIICGTTKWSQDVGLVPASCAPYAPDGSCSAQPVRGSSFPSANLLESMAL